jgi:hypothetical protein
MKFKGNPNWCRTIHNEFVGVRVTEFEKVTQSLGLLTLGQQQESVELHAWVRRHRTKRYVPEVLLKYWHMEDMTYDNL